MAKKNATLEKPIIPDENLDSEVQGLTSNPFENPLVPQQSPLVTTTELKVEFKQPAFEVTRFTTVFSSLSMTEISDIHAALVANSDKQPETKIFLFLRSLEEIGIKYGRILIKE